MPDFEKNDIIAPRAHLLQWRRWGLEVRDTRPDGAILANPLGGGFMLIFSPEKVESWDFVKVPEDLLTNPGWYKAEFRADWLEANYVGWTTGARWNGWGTPHFEFEEAMRYAGDTRRASGHGLQVSVTRYNRRKDSFITKMEEWPEVAKGEYITITRGRSVKVYPIGAGSWTWSEVNEEEEESGSVKDWRPPY